MSDGTKLTEHNVATQVFEILRESGVEHELIAELDAIQQVTQFAPEEVCTVQLEFKNGQKFQLRVQRIS